MTQTFVIVATRALGYSRISRIYLDGDHMAVPAEVAVANQWDFDSVWECGVAIGLVPEERERIKNEAWDAITERIRKRITPPTEELRWALKVKLEELKAKLG